MTPTEIAQGLINDGYYQVSRAHRHIAKLPEGKTGKQALYEATMENYKHLDTSKREYWEKRNKDWVKNLGEIASKDQYLRVYATSIQVSQAVFNEFRRLGGRTAR